MVRHKVLFVCLIAFCSMLVAGCGRQDAPSNINWIPSEDAENIGRADTENMEKTDDSELQTEGSDNGERYSTSEIADAFIDPENIEGADMVWANQCAVNKPSISEKELKRNLLTFYFSSSEGDDANDGLSPDSPKKNPAIMSEISGVNVLLKCGDVFAMPVGITLKSNSMLGCYGKGDRPVLDYRQKLDVHWEKVDGYDNLWKAGFEDLKTLYVVEGNETNGNIGQLWIGDSCSFNRMYKLEEDINLLSDMSLYGDGYFYIDTKKSYIYLTCQKDPNNEEIKFSLPASGVSIFGNDVIMRGVEIVGAGCHGVSMMNIDNVEISCCYIHHIGGAILRNQNVRYGNAIELWDSGSNLCVKNNVIEWIYDTAMTNQGSSMGIKQENISFFNNICRFSFWGIESWGDSNAENGFRNISYSDNAMMYICDLTSPETCVYANSYGQTLDEKGEAYAETIPYVTCRGDNWPFSRMSAINITLGKETSSLGILGNVCWDTKRCMTLLALNANSEKCLTMNQNTFYTTIPNSDVCLYRYTDNEGKIHYENAIGMTNNNDFVSIKDMDQNKYDSSYKELSRIVEAVCQ